ncbi:hypothetical protein HJ01_01616 [Flavobacterium frigoris PS1]|uniref:Uncharacterized protein n=1 Tax=Flavobacterium frigoris (strain PS1) TaxID=1086011 RepID=H7FR67_FLAFP|nr:hypothetical protein HJ01_01616 [Flavobacterium frigoris PS1]
MVCRAPPHFKLFFLNYFDCLLALFSIAKRKQFKYTSKDFV